MNPGEKDPRNPEDLESQIREMLRNSNINFVLDPARQRAAEGTEKDPSEAEAAGRATVLERLRSFGLKPREVRDYLDRFVVQQSDAKKVLSVAVCDHYNHVRQCVENPAIREREYTKQNVILLGPTGVGKTYLMRCIAKLIGVPFAKADATKFSETGYVGYDVEDIVRDLVRMANSDTELAQYGIIYIDEIDKIASQPVAAGRDVSGRGVQVNLLKLMEETEVNLHSQTDLIGQMQAIMDMQRGGRSPRRTINTRHILFIVSGAFDKLGGIVESRLKNSRIGFSQEETARAKADSEYLKLAQAADFIQYGFEPEFIGRLPVRVTCDPLSVDDLEQVLLKSEGSILRQYRDAFRAYGIEFDMTREAIREIAQQAHRESTGARGLLTVLERVFRDFKFELPSTSIRHLEVTTDTVASPGETLRVLLRDNHAAQRDVLRAEVNEFADRFQAAHGLKLAFTPEAVAALVELSVASDKTIRALCEEKFRDFEYGLKLISRNTGSTVFALPREAVENPDRELSRWIIESYRAAGQQASAAKPPDATGS